MDCSSLRLLSWQDVPLVHEQLEYAVDRGELFWERRPRASAEWRSRWLEPSGRRYPAFVWFDAGRPQGWVAAGQFHERAAYWPTVEMVAWVVPDARGLGIGTALVRRACAAARDASFHSVVAIVPAPSAQLGAWLAHLGFREIGRISDALSAVTGKRAITLHQRMLAETAS